MSQVFIPKSCIDTEKKQAILIGDSFHHLIHVLRKQKGDSVEAFDGQGGIYRARIRNVIKDRVTLDILETRNAPSNSAGALTLGVAILKGKKMSWLVQKVTELGVQTVVPLITRRTIVQLSGSGPKGLKEFKGSEKWEKVAVEASKQCGRAFVPNFHHPIKLKDFLPHTADFDAKLLAWEGAAGETVTAQSPSLKQWALHALPGLAQLNRPPRVFLLVGPEGGFDAEEVEQARDHGFTLFGLGKNILRSETAALIACALVDHELNGR